MKTADLFENEFLNRAYNEYMSARMERARLIGDSSIQHVENVSPDAVLIRLLQQERHCVLADIKRIKDQRRA